MYNHVTRQYLKKLWTRSMMFYDITRPEWVKDKDIFDQNSQSNSQLWSGLKKRKIPSMYFAWNKSHCLHFIFIIICKYTCRMINSSPLEKMAASSQMTFSNVFSWMEMYEFHLRFQTNLFLGFEWTYSIGSDNGLALTKRQARNFHTSYT